MSSSCKSWILQVIIRILRLSRHCPSLGCSMSPILSWSRFYVPSVFSLRERVHDQMVFRGCDIRPQIQIIPRPLHDPTEDHAIVLYDPTVDARETDEERMVREKERLRTQAERDAREKTAGLFNPHQSLRELLGSGKEKDASFHRPTPFQSSATSSSRRGQGLCRFALTP